MFRFVDADGVVVDAARWHAPASTEAHERSAKTAILR
jgi:hypothetical protein